MTEFSGIIYCATNTVNGKVYIGCTKHSLEHRKKCHYKGAFRANTDTHFGRALRKYGAEAFKWSVLEENISERSLLLIREMYWIAQYNSNNPGFGYNMTPGGESVVQTEEIRKKIGAANSGKHASKATRLKLREARKNQTFSEETRQKIAASRIGKHLTESAKAKVAYAMHIRVISDETRKKISLSKIGKNAGPENSMYGKHITEEHRYKLTHGYVCEYCGREFGKHNYNKHHGEKCKLNPNQPLNLKVQANERT